MRRAAVTVVAVVAASVVVAGLVGAAGADRPTLAMPSVVRWWPLAVGLAVALVATAVFLHAAMQLPALGDDDDRASATSRRWIQVVLAVVVVTLATVFGPRDEPPATEGEQPAAPTSRFEQPQDGPAVPITARPSPLALAVLGGVAVAAVVAGRAGRRRTVPPGPDPGELDQLVSRVVHDVAATDDPREAVLRAFAAFEEALAARGHARAATETQAAWVERLLLAQGASPAPARRLRERFELARFAGRPVSAADRDAALADLDALVGEGRR